jgi:sorting nexin-8
MVSYQLKYGCRADPGFSMWHELRVVLHNRENTLLSQTVQTFAREEQEFSEHVVTNWVALGERIDNMPFE